MWRKPECRSLVGRLKFALILAAIASYPLLASAEGGSLDAEVLGRVKRSTVRMVVKDASGADLSGSGCLVADTGIVLTNAHVLGMFDADSRPPRKVEVVIDSGETNSQTLPAKLLGADRQADLAAVRVEGTNLPVPLSLATAAGLHETELVYVFGFPFGSRLGDNVTVTKSSVSSLRKENGQLQQIQLEGGVNPGNSGGPVVDGQGRLVGVAVAAVSGTNIGFAIPVEQAAGFLAGRLNDYGTDLAVREGDKIKILYRLNFVDPLGHVKDVRIEHYQGPPAAPNPDADKRPAQRPGETPVSTVNVPYEGTGAVAGELEVEPLKDPKFVYWFRPVFRDGNGQERFAHELSGMRAPPFVRRPLAIRFKPQPGPAAVFELSNVSTFRLRLPGSKEETRSLLLKVVAKPEYQPAGANQPPRLSLKFISFTIASKVNGKPEKNEAEFRRIGRNVLQTSAVLEMDTDGTPVRSELDLGKSEAALHSLLTEIGENLLQAIELLAVPLPNGVVQPLATFRTQRDVAAGMPGLAIPALVDLKFKYQGTHNFAPNRPSAMFDFNGSVRPRRGDKTNMGGRVFGRVEIAPETGEILLATTDLKVDVDLQTEAGIIRVTGTMRGELKPATNLAPPERKPDKPPVLEPDDQRIEWAFNDQGKDKSSGSFKRNDDATWVESNSRGEQHIFEEWQRNSDFVMLVDPKRKIYLRCYADHTDIFSNKATWVTLFKGEWAKK
ncbi:MAG TPA: serine protease [Pirellulales bacterium]|jgi:hypothetical protein|nr:serine protease [Pirellulales bacterium]